MASDFAIAPARVRAEPWIIEAAFVGFLLLVFFSLQPFAPRYPEVLRLGEDGITGQGDVMRQISYLTVFGIVALGALRKFGVEIMALVPLFLMLALCWCLSSSAWAAEGGVTFRRAGLEVIIVLTAMWGVETIGIERSLTLLRAVLIGVLVVNWLSVPLTARAIHQPGEPDPGIVGAWRGLYYHKNIAGAVSAISAMVFLFFALERRSRLDWFLVAAALGFAVMTRSKSSLGLLALALAGGAVYRVAWKRGLDRTIAVVAALLVVLVAATVVLVDWSAIVAVVSDPQEFTGRTAIWAAESAFIADHPLLGAGFGSFTNTGTISPLHNYVDSGWIETISHGHNGYLQLTVELGAVGLVLSMLALVVQPAIMLWRRDAVPVPFKAFLFSLFIFFVLHNFMETDFLAGDGPAWVAFLIMLAMLRQAQAIAVREAA